VLSGLLVNAVVKVGSLCKDRQLFWPILQET
jgi:hypothetical protein